MIGRFTVRRASAPELAPAPEGAAPALDGVAWTVFPEPTPEPVAPSSANPLLTDKLLDAKVRLHRRLIEEINLSALEKLPEDEMRAHIQQLVTQYIVVERLALNSQELNEFVSEILDEMTGLGPLEPLLKDPTVNDILINGHESTFAERHGRWQDHDAQRAVGVHLGEGASHYHRGCRRIAASAAARRAHGDAAAEPRRQGRNPPARAR